MQAKNQENFCRLLQLFDNQMNNFQATRAISPLSCEDIRFFTIFAIKSPNQ